MVKKIINIPDLGEAEDVEVIEICANKQVIKSIRKTQSLF